MHMSHDADGGCPDTGNVAPYRGIWCLLLALLMMMNVCHESVSTQKRKQTLDADCCFCFIFCTLNFSKRLTSQTSNLKHGNLFGSHHFVYFMLSVSLSMFIIALGIRSNQSFASRMHFLLSKPLGP